MVSIHVFYVCASLGVGEDSWESLGLQKIQPVHPKRNQSWIFIGRTDVEVETPILWPPDAKNWLIGKDPDAGKDQRWEKKGTTEDEMVGWHHQLNGREFEQAPGVGYGQGSLVCCSPWGRKMLDTTEQLNWNELVVRRLRLCAFTAKGAGSMPGQRTKILQASQGMAKLKQTKKNFEDSLLTRQ